VENAAVTQPRPVMAPAAPQIPGTVSPGGTAGGGRRDDVVVLGHTAALVMELPALRSR
jgi:hypothetical protein